MKYNSPFYLLRSIGALALWLALSTVALHAAPVIPLPDVAVGRISSPQILVSPDRADWTYAPGDPVRFTIRVLYDQQPLEGAEVSYHIGPEKFENDSKTAVVPPEGLVIEADTLESPGFLRCIATAEIQGTTYKGLATVGFAPERIQPTQTEPDDFDAFWTRHLAAAREIPLRIQKTLVPEQSTSEVNVFNISYQSWNRDGRSMRFYGTLSEPVEPGHYPAVLQVPGAGVRSYSGAPELARKGLIVMTIGIHGIPIDMPDSVYANLRNGALYKYNSYNLDDPETYYYLRVYLACVRANDVLTSHESWDGKSLVVSGGSQGGQLTIVTSALDPRVTGSVSNYPAYCDVTGYLHNRAGGWPHHLADESNRSPKKIRTTAYFDAVNFARRLKAPVSFAWGYNDEVCPPTSMFAAYNVVTAPKTLLLHLQMGHSAAPEFSDRYHDRIVAMAKAD